jgi:hypothetical protein
VKVLPAKTPATQASGQASAQASDKPAPRKPGAREDT